MHLAAHPEKAAEAHHQRTPAKWIDVRARAVSHQQTFVDVKFEDVHLKRVRIHVLAGRTSCTMPSICTGHSRTRGGATAWDSTAVNPAMPNLSRSWR